MRRAIGVSTHAISQGDVRSTLNFLRSRNLSAVELSALQDRELQPLLEALSSLDLSGYSYVSFHAPNAFDLSTEQDVADLLASLIPRQWPVIVHPDVLSRVVLWERFGEQLCIENMDKRKSFGRTTAELEDVFARFPRALFCFDIGHARQVDPTMSEAALILSRFRERLKQVHLSEVSSLSRHEGISFTALNSFRKVAHLIPTDIPVILETPVPVDQIETQLYLAEKALSPDNRDCSSSPLNGPAMTDSLSPARDSVRS